jgi:hypothetical protein
MHYCFLVWHEKVDVENWVNAPLRGKFKAIVDCRHHLNHPKGAMSPGHKLGSWLINAEILAF